MLASFICVLCPLNIINFEFIVNNKVYGAFIKMFFAKIEKSSQSLF